MSGTVFNFGPGPAMLPPEALRQAQAELLNFSDTGFSILEHSHRGPDYERVHGEAAELLRELLSIPPTHRVLFMQGGASAQFALVPLNLIRAGGTADYVITGHWSEKALAEAATIAQTRIAYKPRRRDKQTVFTRIPDQAELDVNPAAAYLHITSNNTLYGTQYTAWPDTGSVPLVADMSSDLCSRPLDVARFGIIYACAQKNLGPSGVTVVIARDDVLERARTDIPRIFRYREIAAANSLQNTPTTFSIYVMRGVLRWAKAQGGLSALAALNQRKAAILYELLDAHPDFYISPVQQSSRSLMNVVFHLPNPELDKRFVAEAREAGMRGLKGHRLAGGVRASIYNAMPAAGVCRLAEFMREFRKRN